MKIRTDFVTNSSSSSFILAQKGEFTEKQKNALVEYVLKKMIGKVLLTPESTDEEIEKVFDDEYIPERDQEHIREALKNGKTIYGGWISFDDSDYHYANVHQKLWEKLEESGEGNFEGIDVDLSY